MTPDAPSIQPSKRSWKRLILVLACVVAVIMITLLMITPEKEPVAFWFVRSTNELGVKNLVFQGTNGVPTQILFYADVFTNATYREKAPARVSPVYGWARTNVAAGSNFDFALKAPAEDVPYYVVWAFYQSGPPATRWEKFRTSCHDFFKTHGMPALSRRFSRTGDAHSIPSTEIKE